VTQTLAAGGLRPASGFTGDFNGDGLTDLVVGNTGDGHLALLLGGSDGLSLAQTLVNPGVPEPTGLSFAGVSDGVLSFYASTAGHEAAVALAFNLSGVSGPAGGPPPVEVTPGLGASPGEVLAQAAGGSIQQVAQLLSLSGSALDLAATLLTVSAVPGDAAGEFGAGLVATVSSPGLGQGLGPTPESHGSGGSGAEPQEETKRGAGPSPGAAEVLPAWVRISIGLEWTWEQTRAAVLGLERKSPAESPKRSKPAEVSPGAGRPVPAPSGAPAVGRMAAPGPVDASQVHDAAVADLVAEGQREKSSASLGPAGLGELAQAHHPAAIGGLVAAVVSATTAGVVWRLRANRLPRSNGAGLRSGACRNPRSGGSSARSKARSS
jgi:hypothetical protein